MVVVGYVGEPRAEVWGAVLAQHPEALFCSLAANDEYAYANLIRRFWTESGPLLLNEQDVVPPPGAIAELLECEEDWCAFPVWIETQYQLGTLGLTKFGAELKSRLPGLADRALGRYDPLWARQRSRWKAAPACWPTTVEWSVCDFRLREELERSGVLVHAHSGPATHLHDYGERSDPRLMEVTR